VASERISLREVSEADWPRLATLLSEGWPEVDWPLRFRRQWRENPAWEPGVSMGWVHEEVESGELASYFGSIPIPYQVSGADARAFAATSLFVRPAHRRRGLARALVESWLAQEGGELWINSTSNEQSLRIFEQLRLPRYERAEHEREALWVTRPLDHARRVAARRLGGGRRWLRLPLALAGAAALRWKRPGARDRSGWSWERITACGDGVDELWERERTRHATMIRRDSRTLEWLYLRGPRRRSNALLLGRAPDGVARALAGFREAREEPRLHLVDLFGALEEPGALASLVRRTDRLAAELSLSIARLWLPVSPELLRELDRVGVPSRPCRGEIYYRRISGDGGDPPTFTDLDGDRCLDLLA